MFHLCLPLIQRACSWVSDYSGLTTQLSEPLICKFFSSILEELYTVISRLLPFHKACSGLLEGFLKRNRRRAIEILAKCLDVRRSIHALWVWMVLCPIQHRQPTTACKHRGRQNEQALATPAHEKSHPGTSPESAVSVSFFGPAVQLRGRRRLPMGLVAGVILG